MIENLIESILGSGLSAAIAVSIIAIVALIAMVVLAFYLSGPDRSGT